MTIYCKCGKKITSGSKSGRCRGCANRIRPISEQMKEKCRLRMIGKLNPMYGKPNNKLRELNKIYKETGNPFLGKKHSEETKKIMSLKALERFKNPKNHPSYIDGRKLNPYPNEFLRLKEKIKNRDTYTCQNCGMTEEEHIIVIGYGLTCHHIDYDKYNNNLDNLITLCTWCNVRANKNRDYWTEYYQQKVQKL